MFPILTEDVGPESHLFAVTDPLSAIFRHRRNPGAHVTIHLEKISSAFGLSGSASLSHFELLQSNCFFLIQITDLLAFYRQCNVINSTLVFYSRVRQHRICLTALGLADEIKLRMRKFNVMDEITFYSSNSENTD